MYIYGIVTIVIAIVKVTLFINEVLENSMCNDNSTYKKNAWGGLSAQGVSAQGCVYPGGCLPRMHTPWTQRQA